MARDDARLLSELQRPDEASLCFNPLGLGGRLAPKDAAAFQAASIERAVLAADVPDDVCGNFERARKLHLHGVIEFEFFTAAFDYALLTLESALRLRFISYYDHEIPVARKGVEETLPVRTFDDVRRAAGGSQLRTSAGVSAPLPIGAGALLDWARDEGVLPGTRTRVVDRALADLRNLAAHPVAHSAVIPPHSATMLNDVAEVINRLWGHDTPGGRLFPSPLERGPRVVALAPGGRGAAQMRLDQVAAVNADERSWRYAVFLAVESEELMRTWGGDIGLAHEPGFQTTAYPCELLWEGNWPELVEAIEAGTFSAVADSVQLLDRLFFIRAAGDSLDRPRSGQDLDALDVPPDGSWFAIIADGPQHAWVHVRDHENGSGTREESCGECFVRVVGRFATGVEASAFAHQSIPTPHPATEVG